MTATTDAADKPYKVMIDDNFHYMDESYRELYGSYATRDEAVTVCKTPVERSLRNSYQPGMTAEQLFAHYRSFGDDPFVLLPDGPAPDGERFSAWRYAEERAKAMTNVSNAEPKK